jgi:hypothetical protein
VTIAVTSAPLASSASAFELLTRFDTGQRGRKSFGAWVATVSGRQRGGSGEIFDVGPALVLLQVIKREPKAVAGPLKPELALA